MKILTGARDSLLSRAQFQEMQTMVQGVLELDPIWVTTIGDRDKKTSLRSMGKTDFFTKELDEMLLRGEIRLAIHSAKDLPDPLPHGLSCICITKSIDPRDSLVLQEGVSLFDLPLHSIIATSSIRREEVVRSLRPDLKFVDVRGTILERLFLLEKNEVSGVVVAEAALIRLGLTHLNRWMLPGETTAHQGSLAVTARSHDLEMKEIYDSLFGTRSETL